MVGVFLPKIILELSLFGKILRAPFDLPFLVTILNTAVFCFFSLSRMTELKSCLGMSVLDVHVCECEVCVCRMGIILLL